MPKYQPNKVIVWDDMRQKAICELEFRAVVRNVELLRNLIIVLLPLKTFFYSYSFDDTPKKLKVIESQNELGLCAAHPDRVVIPAETAGFVQVVHVQKEHSQLVFEAHTTQLAALALDPTGLLLATASMKGTLIRVWDVTTGKMLWEFRRGTDRAIIWSINFDKESSKIVVSSDKGTVHVFRLIEKDKKNTAEAGTLDEV